MLLPMQVLLFVVFSANYTRARARDATSKYYNVNISVFTRCSRQKALTKTEGVDCHTRRLFDIRCERIRLLRNSLYFTCAREDASARNSAFALSEFRQSKATTAVRIAPDKRQVVKSHFMTAGRGNDPSIES